MPLMVLPWLFAFTFSQLKWQRIILPVHGIFMKYDAREVKAGLLVLMSFSALAVFLIAITGVDWERKEKVYKARFGFSGGIERGAVVRFGGLLVGAVTDIYLAPDDNSRIEVVLTVDSDTPVRKDSEASIAAISLMSEYYIEITPGSHSAELLPSESYLRARDVPSLTRLGEPFMNMSEQMGVLLLRLNDMLNDENRRRLSGIFASTDSLLSGNLGQFSSMVENLNALTVQMQSLGERLDKIMGDNTETLQTSLLRLNDTMARADTVLQTFHQTMQVLNGMMVANEAGLNESMQNFEKASQNFEQFSRTIKERPWTLVRKAGPPERELP